MAPSALRFKHRARDCAIHLAFIALTLFALNAHAAEVIPPKPDRYFNDSAGIVSQEASQRFNEQLAQFERETSNQIVVAIFPKMQSEDDVAAYAQRVAESWQVGQKDKRNGVVLFVFIADRKTSIQVGYGLEGALPDITAFDIRENRINSHFRQGDYEGGLADGIDSIFKAIRGEYKGTGKTVRERSSGRGNFGGNLIFFIIFIAVCLILSRIKPRRGYHYSSGGGGWAWSSGGGGGGWSSGGGGGGFSGFSGGGGSFGGGGSSGSW
jgi:uncharacterized protein